MFCFQLDSDNIVTSKFFNSEDHELKSDELNGNKVDEMEVDSDVQELKQKQEERENLEAPKIPIVTDKILTMEVDDVMASSPKENKVLVSVLKLLNYVKIYIQNDLQFMVLFRHVMFRNMTIQYLAYCLLMVLKVFQIH